jgi:hypothetical protein
MNYLQLVNGVLDRLREPQAPTVRTTDDPVVNVAKHFVNDAKRYVEAAHGWNATRQLWQFPTVSGTPAYVLDETKGGARITQVSREGSNVPMDQWDLRTVIGQRTGSPWRWAWEGTSDEGNLMLRFDPIPDDVYSIFVLGHKNLPDLDRDTDELRLPAQPVLYYALALAARERGEVGGQTAAELFNMAQQYISDAIALDATLSPTEYTWAVV